MLKVLFIPFELLLFLFLIGSGTYFSQQTPLQDLTKAYLEKACISGGFAPADIISLKSELSSNGYDTAKINITISPSISSNVTTTSYAKRGTIISLRIEYTQLGLLDTLFKKVGSTTDTKNNCIRYGMSEKF